MNRNIKKQKTTFFEERYGVFGGLPGDLFENKLMKIFSNQNFAMQKNENKHFKNVKSDKNNRAFLQM